MKRKICRNLNLKLYRSTEAYSKGLIKKDWHLKYNDLQIQNINYENYYTVFPPVSASFLAFIFEPVISKAIQVQIFSKYIFRNSVSDHFQAIQ